MLGVIGLPVLLPVAALLQLLFPGILRDQWRQYRVVVQVLLTQSTLIFVRWALLRWFVSQPGWWLSEAALWDALVCVALVGAVAAWLRRDSVVAGASCLRSPAAARRSHDERAPARIEFWAFGVLAGAGLIWGALSVWRQRSPWDSMAVVTIAALAGVLHLVGRRRRAVMQSGRGLLSTELVFLATEVIAGVFLGVHLQSAPRNLLAAEAIGDWPTFRGNVRRTGAASEDDPGPRRPIVLWKFEPKEPSGRVLIHSSAAVIGNQLYVGAMHQTLSSISGLVYCIAADGTANGVSPGARIWSFSAGDTMKAVFSSPTVVDGRLYVGEGYHQDQKCRLFCLDSRSGEKPLWSFDTASHVESSPTFADGLLYFGAGDDGLMCVAPPLGEDRLGSMQSQSIPKKVWQVPGLHVDSSPAVADGRVFVGSVVGDEQRDLFALAADAKTGQVLWKIPAPLPLAAAPACAAGRVIFSLGNGKLSADADQPEGRIWCLDAASGDRQWEFRAAGSILSSPAALDGRVYCCSRDRHCYALRETNGDVLWKRDLGEPIAASPVVTHRAVYVLTVSGTLHCLDAATGETNWRLDDLKNEDDDAYSSPALADGRLYVASGGKLYCLGDKPTQ